MHEVIACVPGANGRGPASEMVAVYEMLLNGGVGWNGAVLLQPATVTRFTERVRVGMFDEVAQDPTDWSLGCFVGARVLGRHASPRAFGHGGSQSSIGFCDPELNFSVVLFCNGRPGAEHHRARLQALCGAVYEDVVNLKIARKAAAMQRARELAMHRVAGVSAPPPPPAGDEAAGDSCCSSSPLRERGLGRVVEPELPGEPHPQAEDLPADFAPGPGDIPSYQQTGDLT